MEGRKTENVGKGSCNFKYRGYGRPQGKIIFEQKPQEGERKETMKIFKGKAFQAGKKKNQVKKNNQ